MRRARQSRLVALNEMLEVNCALLIDRLVGLRGVEAFTASQAPAGDAPPGSGSATPTQPVRAGRKSTCRRCRSNPNF